MGATFVASDKKKMFFNGRHVVCTGLADYVGGQLHYEVRTVDDFNETPYPYHTSSMVPASSLQEVCTELFPMHAQIRSLLSANIENALIGKVVGYELHKNRVIVVSNKIEKYAEQRSRYSYAITELALYTAPKLGFEVGGIYKINMQDTVLAVDELFNPGYVSLVFIEGQQDTKRNVPMSGTLDEYLKHGIHTIEYLEG